MKVRAPVLTPAIALFTLLLAAAPASTIKKTAPPPRPAGGAEPPADAKTSQQARPEPEAKPVSKVDPKIFDQALEDYFDGNQRKAAAKLFAYVEATAQTEENYAWAQYF